MRLKRSMFTARGEEAGMRCGESHAVTRGAAAVTIRCRQPKMSIAENVPATASLTLVVVALLLLCVSASGAPLEFSLHQIEGEQKGPVVLVIGGIQGDEPGGFNAASLLVTHYRLHNGAVWGVPNLNFESIVRRSRGVHGDMNRKFPTVSANDPDYARVERIKTIITDPKVGYVLNLHDGSGFYRPRYIVDRDARLYRVEFYRGRRFAGMVLVRFVDSDRAASSSITRPLS